MKRPTIFRTIVLLTGVCVAYWQAPKIIDMVDKIRGGMSPAAALAGLTGHGQPAADNDISLEQLRSALSGAGASPTVGGAKPNGAKPSGEVIVFTPNGAALTEAQKHALLEKANRMRPSGSGVAPDRISLPPGVSPTPRPPVGADDDDDDAPAPPKEPEHEKDPAHSPQDTADQLTPKAPAGDEESESELEAQSSAAIDDEPIGIHGELREMLDEIAPPNHDGIYLTRRASRVAWRSSSLPRGPRPAFIIGPPGSGIAP